MNSQRIAQIVEPIEQVLEAYSFDSSPKLLYDGCQGTARRADYVVKYNIRVRLDGRGEHRSELSCHLSFCAKGCDEILYRARCIAGPQDPVEMVKTIAKRDLERRLVREFGKLTAQDMA